MSSIIGQELHPERLLPSLTSGLVVGIAEVIVAISFAALIFSGDLSSFVSNGIGLALVGVAITSIFVALMTSLPGIVSGNQDAPVAITAVVAATIVAAMPAAASSEAAYTTVVAFIAISTFLTGIVLLGLGYFGLGNLVRFLPYPVVGGFLAGTGWLLVTGAISMLVDVTPSSLSLTELFQPEILIRWLPGLAVALALLFLSSRSDHYLIMPAVIFGSIALFFVFALIGGTTTAELEKQGWLLGTFQKGTLWQPVLVNNFELINWSVLWQQAAGTATIILVSAVSLLLNASGLELNSGHDLELNRELRAAGIGNSLAGLAAGLVGFQGISLSSMNLRLGANSRIVGLVAAVICILVLILGGSLLSYFPKVVLGGLLLYLGLVFLVRWVYQAYFQLPKIDYFIIMLILFVVAAVGFLEAVAVGILLAVVLFVVGYSRIDVVKHRLTGVSHQSRVTRPINQRELLRRQGARIFILHLQGFIFFGTADNLLNTVRERAIDSSLPQVSFVILDFRQVTGIDSTALLRFERMVQLGREHGFQVIITEPSAQINRQLQSCDFCSTEGVTLFFPTMDHGIEWCENEILEETGEDPEYHVLPIKEQLALILPGAENLSEIVAYFDQIDVEPGQYLIRQGEKSDSLYFIESGQVTAQLESPHKKPIRLETMGAGRVVGELGLYLEQERTAAIVVDTPGTVYRLSLEDLHKMERSDPESASTLHQIVIRLLAERVTHLVNTVNALET